MAEGIDPSAERKAVKEARLMTFEAVAEEWLAIQSDDVSAGHVHESKLDADQSRSFLNCGR